MPALSPRTQTLILAILTAVGIIVLIVAVVVPAFLRDFENKKAGNFLARIDANIQMLNRHAKHVEATLTPVRDGQQVNLADVKEEVQGYRSALTTMLDKVDSIRIPTKASAQKLLEKYRDVLQVEEKFVTNVEKFIQLLEDTKLPPATRSEHIGSMVKTLESLMQESKDCQKRMEKAQVSFANDYKIKVLPASK